MIVLDYLKKTGDLAITVPPFHTGHLGLIPGTEVLIGIMAPWTAGPAHCEVVVSPFSQNAQHMARISCTMKDDIGVVGKLVSAISRYGVNIASQESSSINHLNHHTINMIVDLSTSSLEEERTKESIIRLYSRFDNLVPLHDFRYVLLFESIMIHCGDMIVWEDLLGRDLPKLTIQPLSNPKINKKQQTTIVQKVEAKPYHVQVSLPENMCSMIRNTLRHSGEQDIGYILLSDTDERNLRIVFLTREIAESLVHIGFYHNDIPGALAEIMQAAASSRFNILTSLIRKQTATRNVWEALLHYRGDEAMPSDMTYAQGCSWVATLLKKNAGNLAQMVEPNVEVGPPLYPKRKSTANQRIALAEGRSAALPREPQKLEDLLAQRIADAKSIPLGSIEASRTNEVLSLVERRVRKGDKPTIFLSYPRNATRHVELLRDSLSTHYNFSEYQQADGEIIVEEVLRRVLDSDFFIGIWHHDDQMPVGNGKFSISPWMPFEYGIALSARKQNIVIHSDKLDERVWKRINPHVTNPEYSDLFWSRTLQLVESYCLRNFK